MAPLVQYEVRALVEDLAAVFEEALIKGPISLCLLVLLNIALAEAIVDLVHTETFLCNVHG